MTSHTPDSPDLVPCDWFLFPYVKRFRRRRVLEDAEDALLEYLDIVNNISDSAWADTWVDWSHRVKKRLHIKTIYIKVHLERVEE